MAWTAPTPQDAGVSTPTRTPRRYRCRLESVGDVKRELGKLYRESRSQIITVESASKLAHVLFTLSRCISDSDHEARLDALEAKVAR